MRLAPADAHRLLAWNFPATVFLSEGATVALADLAQENISGGAVYDALVGAAAKEHGLSLVSRDERARPAYEVLGVKVHFLA